LYCRFKTFLCERGTNCNRPICFFAHNESELRELPQGLQRLRSPYKPAGSHHSSTAGGAGSSRQAAAAAGMPQAQGGTTMVLVPAAAGGSSQVTYVAQQGAAGYAQQPPQQQLQVEGSEQGSQMVMGYMPVMQQQGVPQQHGVQYMAIPVQQGGRISETGLAAGPQSPQMQLLQQGQVLYAPSGDGERTPSGVQTGVFGQQPLQLQYVSYPPQQLAYGTQPAPQGQYGAQYGAPGRQQVTIGYQPVQMGGMQGYSSPQGVLMVRPAPQRGATVAVIPAGPSAWSGSLLSAESGEAPSLEALCAAMNHMAVPTNDAQLELLLQQYQQQAAPGQPQQQQVLAAPQMQAAAAGAAVQSQQGVQLCVPGAPGVQQVLVAAPGQQQLQQQQQQHSGQLLPAQQMMVVMPQDGSAVQGGQLGWGGIGGMQPGM
jgi:hypothetical protein